VGGVAGSICGCMAQVSSSVLDVVLFPFELNTKHADLLRVLEKKSLHVGNSRLKSTVILN
jgi:hypothetical protein